MALAPRLDLRQSQSLVMTPQLQQAIKLLQFSNFELADYIEEELQENPMLERQDGNSDAQDALSEPVQEESNPESGELKDIDFTDTSSYEIPEAPAVDYDNLYNNDSGPEVQPQAPTQENLSSPAFAETGGNRSNDFSTPGGGFELTISDNPSLRDHLNGQLAIDIEHPVDKLIGIHLIDIIDESGYITGGLEAIAERLDCSLERVERTLLQMQQFEPSGIFARDLSECLALQLKDRNRYDPAMEVLLANLTLLAERRHSDLCRLCGVDNDDLVDMIAEIQALDPKPALAFDPGLVQPIVPDVLMRARSGGWIIELNPDSLPRVLVNNSYYAEISRNAQGKEEKRYITDHFQSANWLVKALDQRANTILKVATELIKQQDAFFQKGVQYLKPLVLRDIAEAIEMHESTVSRVTTNKFMATPRGIYELKYFFTSSIHSTGGGDAISAESVRHQIKAFIDAEDPNKILSDDKLVKLLKAEGIDIARRTVAKYREAMRISSSVQRRREKSLPR